MASQNTLWSSAGCLPRLGRSLKIPSSQAASARAAAFSTSAPLCKRLNRDGNKKRGVSSLYGSGPKEHLSMSDIPLPKPRDFKPKIEVDKNHGLWGFFPKQGKLLYTPEETEQHGRAWTVEELRRKSWEDLHALWWLCCRERNMLATSKAELERAQLGFGQQEIDLRDEEVRKTMRSIKHALTERYYTWQDAFEAAKSDPEIDLDSPDSPYIPASYVDEAASADGWTEIETETTTDEVTTMPAEQKGEPDVKREVEKDGARVETSATEGATAETTTVEPLRAEPAKAEKETPR